ncbi:MAG: GspE/PulE family protein [Peptostreptococcaceae bacterium]
MNIARKRRLGDILVGAEKITNYQLNEALKSQKVLGKKLGEVLIELNILTEEEIIDAIEMQTGIQKVNLNETIFDRRVLKLIPQNLCEKYMLIPFGINENRIKVALSDPLNIYAIDDISISTGFEVESYITNKLDINKFIQIYYSSEHMNIAAEELSRESLEYKAMEIETEEIDDVKNAPVVKMIEYLFRNSVEMRASDIHIEPFENEVRIRYRIDGQLQTVNSLQKESLGPLVTRIKILAGLNITEKRVPQDGRILTNVDNQEVDLRVSILPVVSGEKIVIRILSRSSYKIGKNELGMNGSNLDKLQNMISKPNGIVLVTGPTGSGKSTTLYTILNELNSSDINIVTIEDPVEYTMNGINQVNVNAKNGVTFAAGLRSILRQDPDIVMIGEIRDEETAKVAVKAAITGHLVVSTLHTNDAPSTITRLIDMGIEPYLVSTAITGVIAQRLVKKVCDNCKESYEADIYEKKILSKNQNESVTLYKAKGCGYCNHTGYKGRTGIYEMMEITREHKDIITETRDVNILRDVAIKHGMETLSDECKKLVLSGITTINELLAVSM